MSVKQGALLKANRSELTPQPFAVERFDYCESEPCENGGTCEMDDNQEEGWRCDCVSGWTGETCAEDKDECLDEPCQNGECSTPEFDQYQCDCVAGYTGTDCEIDIDECESSPCNNDGNCIDEVNSFTCECLEGFVGELCQTEIDECESTPCQNGGSCTDEVARFECVCVDGYEGETCEININECSSNPCVNGGSCDDEVNRFTCNCLAGYTGHHCEEEIDECASSPCQNGATCSDSINRFECTCPIGYSGEKCEVELDECDSNPCQNSAHCIDAPAKYECLCTEGYVGVNCETDPCDPAPCQHDGTCSYTEDGYECLCVPGYTGINCQTDQNECESKPCHNDGVCDDQVGYYTCTCQDGFTGEYCEINIDECVSRPCLNGGSCIDRISNYKCMCRDGYNGTQCEDSTEADWHARTHILSAVLPSILFLIIAGILALLFFAYVRKRRNAENRVNVIRVKPAAKRGTNGHDGKKKFHKHKKTRRLSGTERYDISNDVIQVVDSDYKPEIYGAPTAYVGKMSNSYNKPVMLQSQLPAYPAYRSMMDYPQPPQPIVMNPTIVPPPVYSSYTQSLYGYNPQNQTHKMQSHRPKEKMRLEEPRYDTEESEYSPDVLCVPQYDIHPPPRQERRRMTMSDRHSLDTEIDSDSTTSNTATTAPVVRQKKNKHRSVASTKHETHANTHSRLGSIGDSTENDLASVDEPSSPEKRVHWQHRDMKEMRNKMSKHHGLEPPTAMKTNNQKPGIRKSESKKAAPGRKESRQERMESDILPIHRESTFFPGIKRQMTSMKMKAPMINPGLRFNKGKKKSSKRISFNTPVGLSPINEENRGPQAGLLEKANRISQDRSLPDRSRMERHPPEGGGCSSPESASVAETRDRKDKLGEKLEKGKHNHPLFKLIRSKKPVGINKGRGLARENAFVQDI